MFGGGLDWKSHPSCPVHGAQECEGGIGMMNDVKPPTIRPNTDHVAWQTKQRKRSRKGDRAGKSSDLLGH